MRLASKNAIGICSPPTELMEQAIVLSNTLGLPLVGEDEAGYDFLLKLSSQHLEIRATGEPAIAKGLWVDFVHGSARHRRLHGGRNMLPKAVGVQKGRRPLVFDATAGLGRDSFLIASSGCEVVMFERHPIVAALLADGLKRATEHRETASIAERISLHAQSIQHYLSKLDHGDKRPEVIYLDPMFPPRSKRAKVKKELQILQLLVGEDPDTLELLNIARHFATKRVVVKRPKNGMPLGQQEPSFSMSGKTTRFDIYLATKKV